LHLPVTKGTLFAVVTGAAPFSDTPRVHFICGACIENISMVIMACTASHFYGGFRIRIILMMTVGATRRRALRIAVMQVRKDDRSAVCKKHDMRRFIRFFRGIQPSVKRDGETGKKHHSCDRHRTA
jgi:hypothetical protein